MNFILTKYIYPIPKELSLSGVLKISFDNPRTQKEIDYIVEYIRYSEEPQHAKYDNYFILPTKWPEEIAAISLEETLNLFFDKFSLIDPYVKKFRSKHFDTDIFETIAKMWVIARYDDEGQLKALQEEAKRMADEGEHGFFMLESEHPIVKNSDNLVNYSYLLSLLIHTQGEGYYGKSLILHHDQETIATPRLDRWLNQQLLYFAMFCYADHSHDENRWIFFPYIQKDLFSKAKTLEIVLDDQSKSKILYIAALLRTVGNDIEDEKTKLVILVSILELLLTHSPDFSRFNIEDSISKQFVLKASILIYLNDKTRNLEKIKTRLKTIYDQRSNIAHGNFHKVEKYIQGLSKKEDEEEYFGDLISDMYHYIRAVIEEFIKDRNFVEFLKAN